MKKTVYALVCFLIFTLTSCHLETSDNGDLDGLWQLHTVDSLALGKTADVKDQRVFWAFQVHLMRATKYGVGQYLFRFRQTADSLYVSEPRQDDRMNDDPEVTDASLLQPVEINGLGQNFRIVELSGGTMTLQTNTLRLYFRKY